MNRVLTCYFGQNRDATASAQRGGTDLFARVTEMIVAELEKAVSPDANGGGNLEDGRAEVAQNFVSKRPYTGINSVLLGCAGTPDRNYERPYFLTFKQATELGGSIHKDAKGNLVVFWNVLEKKKEVTNRKGETKLPQIT